MYLPDLKLEVDTEREEKRLLREQLQKVEVNARQTEQSLQEDVDKVGCQCFVIKRLRRSGFANIFLFEVRV